MSKSDVEMEDAEKLSNDSGNNIRESESKVTDAEVEREGEKLHCAAAATVDENKRENGEEDINKSRNEDKEETNIKTEAKDQTEPKSEANDPMVAKGSAGEQINAKSENEELINAKTEAEEETAATSAVGEQTDAKNEAVEQNATNVGLEEEKSTENGMEGEDHVKKVEENSNEHVAEEKPKEIGKNADYVERDLGGQKMMENTDAVNDPREKTQLQTELSANEAPQRQNAELDEVVQGGDEEMEDATNLDGDKTVKDEPKEMGEETGLASCETDGNTKTVETAAKNDGELANQHEAATPQSLVRYSPTKAGDHNGETVKSVFTQATLPLVINIIVERQHMNISKIITSNVDINK